ncbi:hypothetical protein EMIHUDRAFT_200858 [Emiliania huxleyi CCMP1516]|uniref:Uncharacterized protein n=2 Tax=Emiliania huxleyi TaxID=2903 RepID=A0A0D3KLR7_EMIH1|nr:hypothetical protein EMIHUDRAFT_200858 [Emiliania huxleyi CCMP1516]EOD36702.1 hypothetical protein EMIHUDRAFT_200858 [Emiliania huxleyi CCMP1516]|eukprot:XP_005789131.1 hypothetical protein EMIHUDRAFT_200858 [Emiliania huxleyi CCMP1516]
MTKGQMGSLQQRASAALGVKNEAHAMQDVELRNETNVLLVPLIAGLQHKSVVNQLLALMSLSYAALSLVLIVLLSYPDRPCVDEDDRDCEATPRSVFHNLEFWGTFAFSVTEIMISLNVAGALVASTLVAINLEFFEYPSHQIEYSHAILAAGVDVILLMSLVEGEEQRQSDRIIGILGITFSGLCMVAAIVQISLYNGMGMDEDNVPIGETPGHFVEFSFDFDNVFRCDQEQLRLLTTKDREIQIKVDLGELEEFSKRRDTLSNSIVEKLVEKSRNA